MLWLSYRWLWLRRDELFNPIKVSSSAPSLPKPTWRGRLAQALPWLRPLFLLLGVFALTRPQILRTEEKIKADVVDIMMVMDVSESMLAQDFEPNRLEASKKVASDFIERRKHDRIGLVLFAGEAFTQCPSTTDHRILKELLKNVQCGYLEQGTAIGMGMITGVNRLKDSPVKSKLLIVLTDGVNNAGFVEPLTAANAAKELGMKIYTIGVGTRGMAKVQTGVLPSGQAVYQQQSVEIDEELLQQVAQNTGGQYFRATDMQGLEKIYQEIDRLEPTRVDISVVKREDDIFQWFLVPAMMLLLLEIIGRAWLLRQL